MNRNPGASVIREAASKVVRKAVRLVIAVLVCKRPKATTKTKLLQGPSIRAHRKQALGLMEDEYYMVPGDSYNFSLTETKEI